VSNTHTWSVTKAVKGVVYAIELNWVFSLNVFNKLVST
jgi:hypothetical protein